MRDTFCYISPAYRNHEDAAGWEEFLADHVDWPADGFGSGYAWEAAIPPRDRWCEEVNLLNAHLASLASKQ